MSEKVSIQIDICYDDISTSIVSIMSFDIIGLMSSDTKCTALRC